MADPSFFGAHLGDGPSIRMECPGTASIRGVDRANEIARVSNQDDDFGQFSPQFTDRRADALAHPPVVGRRNWWHIASDAGLKSAAVLLSGAASAKRHGATPGPTSNTFSRH